MELINRYCHGYVSIATILVLEAQGIFAYLEEDNRTLGELTDYFEANDGHLNVALNLLVSLGWLEYENDEYALTYKADVRHLIPSQLFDLYKISSSDFLLQASWQEALHLIEAINFEQMDDIKLWQDMLKGVVLAPLLLSLTQTDFFKENHIAHEAPLIPKERFDAIAALLIQEGWLDSSLMYTNTGAYLFKRVKHMGVTVSYQPLFAKLHEVLFGDITQVFGLDAEGFEKHVDRQLNVIGSGSQHHLFFEQFKHEALKLFNHEDFAHQPTYIADMGCGDGTLLKELYTTIVAETPRGKVLEDYPLIMIGADFNDASLQETIKTLKKYDIPHITIKADIGYPQG